jgi:hypothetical protein
VKLKRLFILAFIGSACNQQYVVQGNALGTAAALNTNMMVVQVGNCGPYTYDNEPCVSVTICTPGTTTCQTIPNILVDTGSYGLRIFSSAISIGLTQETNSTGQAIGECAFFGSLNTWGQVQTADVILGGEKAPNVPIQVINSAYAKTPATCTTPATGPSDAGYNGILGVGLFNQDCGENCTTDATNEMYYACTGTTCTNITVTLAQQVSNPVVGLPLDNNGVSLQLPSVPLTGAPTVTGTLTLGIGTQADNTPTGVTVYPADTDGNFITVFGGKKYPTSFIDSGSNGLFFPAPTGLATCASGTAGSGFFCPTPSANYTATQEGSSGTPQNMISFEIYNATDLVNTGNGVFPSFASSDTTEFDWGLPFFLGRTVYVGIEGTTSSIGSGPYWAY